MLYFGRAETRSDGDDTFGSTTKGANDNPFTHHAPISAARNVEGSDSFDSATVTRADDFPPLTCHVPQFPSKSALKGRVDLD